MMRMSIAIAGALLLVAASARATDDKAQPTSGTTSANATGTTTPATEAPVTGDVKSTDPVAMTITILLPSGLEQQLNVEKDAKIERNGSKASFAQLQPGDSVRASLDPKSHKASQIDVKSKLPSSAKDSTPATPAKPDK
jgi:hypothetical protein